MTPHVMASSRKVCLFDDGKVALTWLTKVAECDGL